MTVALLFSPQGSQAVGMGREIAGISPAAAALYRRADETLGWSVSDVCWSGPAERLDDTRQTQPCLFVTSLASWYALREAGALEPAVVAGHSVGEYAALAAARAIDDREAIRLVRLRGEAMAEAASERPGAMAAVLGLEDALVEDLCAGIGNVWPANYNCPGQIVVSGEDRAVEELCAEAENLGARRAIKLKVSGAFHSPLVARAADRLRPAIDRIGFHEPIAPFMSTVTAKIEPCQRFGALLVDQLTAPVRFTQSATELIRDGVHTFVEVGPGNVLSGLVKRIDRSVKSVSVNNMAALDKVEETLSTA